MPILHCYLQYSMKFQFPRNPPYLDEKCCPQVIFWDKIDYWKPGRMPYSLKNHVRKWRFCCKMAHLLTLLEAPGARRAKGARTISDARGSNDARGSPLVPTNPPPLRIRSPRGPPEGRPPFPTTVPKFFVLGIFELRSVHGSTIWEKCVVDRPHTSPQPTRGDGQLKKFYNIVGLQNGNVTCGHNWMVPDDSHAQI